MGQDSNLRHITHGVWHFGSGIITGKGDEFERAKEQFSKITSVIELNEHNFIA